MEAGNIFSFLFQIGGIAYYCGYKVWILKHCNGFWVSLVFGSINIPTYIPTRLCLFLSFLILMIQLPLIKWTTINSISQQGHHFMYDWCFSLLFCVSFYFIVGSCLFLSLNSFRILFECTSSTSYLSDLSCVLSLYFYIYILYICH
jgi:hypothetical protein